MEKNIIPTQWAVQDAVSVSLMDQLREIPESLPRGYINQFLYMRSLYEKIAGLNGDVVECGLGEGNTATMLLYLMEKERAGRKFWGFDSFEGWPSPSAADASSPRDPQKGEWGPDDHGVTPEAVLKRFSDAGIEDALLRLLSLKKGFLRDSLPGFVAKGCRIAFLHIDVDLEEGYQDALSYLWPLVVEGGVVALDEYQEYHPENLEYWKDGHPIAKWPGCDKAVCEFLQGAGKGEVLQHDPMTGKYYMVKGSK